MDNINAPNDPNAPQGDQPQGGDQPTDAGPPPGQDNPPPENPPAPEAGQDQGLTMPPDAGGPAPGEAPPTPPPDTGSPPPETGSPPPTGAAETPPPPPNQGPVEDVLSSAEGGPPDQEMAPEGQMPPPEAPPADPSQGYAPPADQPVPGETPGYQGGVPPITPQSQPEFPGQQPPGQAQPPQGGSKLLPILVIIFVLVLGGVVLAYFMDWISLPFLDNLLGREQIPTEEAAPAEQPTEVSQYPEDDQRKTDLGQIKAALEKYFEDNQKYPVAKTLENSSKSTSAIYGALVPSYIEVMPADPASPTKYYGYQSADGTSFELSAVLDNSSDPEGVEKGGNTLYILTNVSETTETTTEGE